MIASLLSPTEPLRRKLAAPAALFAAVVVGCVFLSSLNLSPPSEYVPLDHLRRRALGAKLMPSREILHFHVEKREGKKPDKFYYDINYRQKGLCGGAKCFFISTHEPTTGYLIGLPVMKGLSMFDAATKASEYALMLEKKYGIRHFFAGPPYVIDTPKYFSDHLLNEYVPFYKDAKSLIIQPSITAPEGSIIIRCYDDRVLYGRLSYILKNMNKFSRARLVKELRGAINLVAHQPELRTDFQLMISNKGQTFHLDLDRVENGVSPKDAMHFEGCLEGAAEFVRNYRSDAEVAADGAGEEEGVTEGGEGEVVGEGTAEEGSDGEEVAEGSVASDDEEQAEKRGMVFDPSVISVEALEKYGRESNDPMATQIANFFVGFFKAQESSSS